MKIPIMNNGFTMKISTPTGKHIGDLTIGRAKVTWRKTRWHTGQSIPLEKVLEILEDLHDKQAAH
jgi:hypothetical protein